MVKDVYESRGPKVARGSGSKETKVAPLGKVAPQGRNKGKMPEKGRAQMKSESPRGPQASGSGGFKLRDAHGGFSARDAKGGFNDHDKDD